MHIATWAHRHTSAIMPPSECPELTDVKRASINQCLNLKVNFTALCVIIH